MQAAQSVTPPAQRDELYRMRHSMAHVLAQAVKSLYPKARLGFGPPTESGFYYDFDFDGEPFKDTDLKKIQAKMKKLLRAQPPLTLSQQVVPFARALEICDELGEPYKKQHVEHLHQRGTHEFSFFTQGHFTDLCEGPHVTDLSQLPSDGFKLQRVSGAYWLNDQQQPMLTRIYALCFRSREELAAHISALEAAARYDHKRLGKELELFCFDDRIGKGLPIWLPAGNALRAAITAYIEDVEFQYGYTRVCTPVIAKKQIYETSGHLQAYAKDMFPIMSPDQGDEPSCEHIHRSAKEEFYLRPMNCPHHHIIYSQKKRTFRDLPLRYAELGEVFRFEKSGELSGLLRVRCFSINDAHIYCRDDQIKTELAAAMAMQLEFFQTFELQPFKFRLSMGAPPDHDEVTRTELRRNNDAKFFGDPQIWAKAQGHLEEILKTTGIDYEIAYGEAAFYGPKIDAQFRNLAGREETLSTIQLDFLSAKKFDLSYQDSNNLSQRPIIIHRAPLSSLERLISLLIEYYKGLFPLWCAPTQIAVIPVHHELTTYCTELTTKLRAHKIRTHWFQGQQSFAKKISLSMRQKIPMILIIGNQESTSQSVTVRCHGSEINTTMTQDAFFEFITHHITTRASRITLPG